MHWNTFSTSALQQLTNAKQLKQLMDKTPPFIQFWYSFNNFFSSFLYLVWNVRRKHNFTCSRFCCCWFFFLAWILSVWSGVDCLYGNTIKVNKGQWNSNLQDTKTKMLNVFFRANWSGCRIKTEPKTINVHFHQSICTIFDKTVQMKYYYQNWRYFSTELRVHPVHSFHCLILNSDTGENLSNIRISTTKKLHSKIAQQNELISQRYQIFRMIKKINDDLYECNFQFGSM